MQPLDDINPEIYNLPPSMSILELLGAAFLMLIVGILVSYIMENK